MYSLGVPVTMHPTCCLCRKYEISSVHKAPASRLFAISGKSFKPISLGIATLKPRPIYVVSAPLARSIFAKTAERYHTHICMYVHTLSYQSVIKNNSFYPTSRRLPSVSTVKKTCSGQNSQVTENVSRSCPPLPGRLLYLM
jgi:hypothetical protein